MPGDVRCTNCVIGKREYPQPGKKERTLCRACYEDLMRRQQREINRKPNGRKVTGLSRDDFRRANERGKK